MSSLKINKDFYKPMTKVERTKIAKELSKKMNVMRLMVGGVRDHKFNGLVISGGHGLGKSHNVMEILRQHQLDNVDREIRIKVIKGHISPLELHNTLGDYNRVDDFVVIDDCDEAVTSVRCMNTLKAATDRGTGHIVTWGSNHHAIRHDNFQFNGRVVILTNHNFKESPHAKALLDRLQYFRLNLSAREVLVLIEQIAKDCGVEHEIADSCYGWMHKNVHRLKDGISIRTFMNLCDLAQIGDVEELAEVVLEDDFYTADEIKAMKLLSRGN